MKSAKKFEARDGDEFSGNAWWLAFCAVLTLTAATRFYKVTEPDHVCWDEVHFGKMGSWYINRTFFFDVHPPLGKMLIGLSGYLTGYDGTFQFEPGHKYKDVNYIGMRVFCTFLGAAIVPFAFVTVWELTKSMTASLFAASFILFDVGMITLNQYILLDPILLFFVTGSAMGMVKVKNKPSFTPTWWFWMFFTGSMLGGAVSVKFVGLFVVSLVGFYSIAELWEILGDLSQSVVLTVKHFMARVLGLILLPIALYVLYFYIHLLVLNRSGSGDGFYSSAFQSRLVGNSLYNASMPREVAYGAVLTIKNYRTAGGYLHSHWHLYPESVGVRQQQITSYIHKDYNNKWLIKPYNSSPPTDKVLMVKNGDLIRLEHVVTRRNLHSHKEVAPITKKHFQVSGYGENGTGDANDIWRLIIDGEEEGATLKTLTGKMKLVHYFQRCVLTTTSKKYPDWGFEQQEVTCNPNVRDRNAFWNVEENSFEKLPDVNIDVYAPGFLERFFESHAVMLYVNAQMKPKEGEATSRPWQWPLNYRGQHFSANPYKIYLLGNPVIWWGNLLLLPVPIMLVIFEFVREQRGTVAESAEAAARKRLSNACWWLFVGWLVHYVPFWGMGRILYFHHYFPALYFSSMLTGVTVDYVLRLALALLPERLSNAFYHWSIGVVLAGVFYSFYLFSPLAYGIAQSSADDKVADDMKKLKWLDTWEF